ncbi:unnamed protein product [Alternaria alternata]
MSLSGKANEDPIQARCKRNVLESFWPFSTTELLAVRDDRACCPWDAYFRHYTAECRKAIEPDHGEHVTIRKHEDIITIIRQLEEGRTKGTIKHFLVSLDTRQTSAEVKAQTVEGSIRLAVRLFAMVNVGAPSAYRTWGPSFLPWDDEHVALDTVLADYFVPSSADTGNMIFEEEFTLFNLQRFTGLDIQWSNNLADHLRLIDNDRKLCVFHHATFLQHQKSKIFPKNLISETLRTLDLLFPRRDTDTQRWLRSQRSQDNDSIHPDLSLHNRNVLMSTDRRAANFVYWRDELMSLKERFDQPKPTSISQFWYDRRNRPQWYTFWIAVSVLCLTVFFGLVQSIEGALQVYKAYHPTSE